MTKQTKDIMKLFGIIALIVLAVVLIGVGPLITLWSLNLLFNLQIAYTFWTWLAMVWLNASTFGAIAFRLNQLNSKLD